MDVQLLRDLLMEIGTEQFYESTDERRTVTSANKVWVLTGRIVDVIGIWAVDDGNRITNLAASGAHDGKTITLDVVQPAGTEVLVAYVSRDGMPDGVAQTAIDWGRIEVLSDIQDFTLDLYTPTTDLEHIMRVYWQMIVMYNAYLLLNNVNFVQSDGNIALFNYQQMSKLWGEGMSTDALFMRLRERIEMIRRNAFMLSTEADTFASPDYLDMWKNPNILPDWLSEIHAAHSRYDFNWVTVPAISA